MSKSKVTKPGTVVFDLEQCEYVNFRADSADHPGKVYVYNPRCGETYLTRVRQLSRKERGEV
jgi:hypothetical protein